MERRVAKTLISKEAPPLAIFPISQSLRKKEERMSQLRVGINGFGRIGRMVFRATQDRFDIVGINNLGPSDIASHLLKYDSTHGHFPQEVGFGENHLRVGNREIPLSREQDPEKIPWKDWGVDLVLECTGAFKKKEDLMGHCRAGAKKVLVSAPSPGADLTIVYGLNHTDYNPEQHSILSNASCTTNCLAPIAGLLHEGFGINKAFMTTIHSYTNDQNVLDAHHTDFRRARAAALSMIPTTTGAARSVGLVLPELKGKIDGVAIRVPTPNVSLVDLVFESSSPLSVESINEKLCQAAEGQLKGILRCEKQPLVSQDFIGDSASSIVDLPSTMVLGDNMGKVFAWYDNEMGFSYRMIDMALYMSEKGL